MTDTYPQEQFIGKTFNERLNKEMIDYYQEKKFTNLGYFPRPGTIAMVHTLEDGALKALGASDPFDQITNNFGKMMAALYSPLTASVNNPLAEIGPGSPPVNDAGTPIPGIYLYNFGATTFITGANGVSSIQIGSGLTAPLITDFNIETPFANGGPEDSPVVVNGIGGYNASTFRASMAANIGSTFGAGTINEMCWFMTWRSGGNMLLSHDAISPGVPFVFGETVFTQYFFQI